MVIDTAQRISFQDFPKKPGTIVVNVDGERIGTYEIVEGGFLPHGRRKPVKRENDARFLVILDEAAKRIRKAHRMMESAQTYFLREEVDLPNTIPDDAVGND